MIRCSIIPRRGRWDAHWETRETGEDRASPKKGPTISNCRYSEAFTLRFGAVSCENKKLTSDGRALFGQIDQSRRSLERPFCLPACHNYRISSIFMIERLMPGNYKRTRYFSCTRCILRDFYLFIYFFYLQNIYLKISYFRVPHLSRVCTTL